MLIVLLEYVTVLLEYFDREFKLCFKISSKFRNNAQFFCPIIIPRHNSCMPKQEHNYIYMQFFKIVVWLLSHKYQHDGLFDYHIYQSSLLSINLATALYICDHLWENRPSLHILYFEIY